MKKLEEDMNNWNGNFPPKTFADGICHLIGSLGNVGVVDTDDGLVVFDIGGNSVNDTVVVTVLSSTTTTSTPPSGFVEMMLLVTLGAGAIVVVIIVLVIRQRKM